MPTRLEQNAQYLTAISQLTDVAALNATLVNESADELSRIAAFYRLVTLHQMDLEAARQFHPKSDRLRHVQLQFVASQEKASSSQGSPGPGITTRGAVRVRGAVRTRGTVRTHGGEVPEQPSEPGWREEAENDPSAAIRRLALLRE